ncbi:hypothetical protein [Halomonas rhizosphaerae]|uniref:hypothetical protein n=1 Tax=Halomonas rhizosphaerae TaxID=3043296 RepID=UPI002DD693CE|nr:hypothetical protein [Halomonas rhizosphaerae]
MGHHVMCMDVDATKDEWLNQGQIPIYEFGLETLVRENHAAGRLAFTIDAAAAAAGVEYGELQFIAVGTPSMKRLRRPAPRAGGGGDHRPIHAVPADNHR